MAKRRGPGDGSISLDKRTGRWRVQLKIPGSPKRAGKAGFKTYRAARAWCDEQRALLAAGVDITPQRVTVGEFLDRWLRDVVQPGRRDNTAESYEFIIESYLKPAFGHVFLIDLRGYHLQRLYAECLARGLSAGTVRVIHIVIHAALNWAVRWELVVRNVADTVQPPAREHKPMEVLTPDEARRLIYGTVEDRLHALWVLAISTGMRQGEMLALALPNLSLSTARVSVENSLGRSGKIGSVKTSSSRRMLDLSPFCVAAVRRHLERRDEERLTLGPAWQGGDRLFTTTVGTPADAAHVRHALEITLRRLGLPRVRFHALRHTAATLMLAAGINPKIVQERLGHSTITMTLDTYSHVLPGMQEEAARQIDILLAK